MSDNKDDTFERFCSFNAFYDSSYKVCQDVRWKDSTIDFEETRIETILETEEDLRNNEYEQLLFSCFSIIERGKPRDIRACHIDDRLVQNSLCEQALLPELAPKFVYDNCATLKNKGMDFALKRMKIHLQKAHREYGRNTDFFGLRIDIKSYFDSIDHKALKESVNKTISNKNIQDLCYYLIDTFSFKPTKDVAPISNKPYYIVKDKAYKLIKPQFFNPKYIYYEHEEKSLGLGSQTSQLFALLTLNEIDHFIKENLHIKYYGRYMDDLYLLHSSSQYLTKCKNEIEKKLQEIGLRLNKKKTTICRITPIKDKTKVHGTPLKYLKWNFYITENGHIIQVPFKSKIYSQKRKLRKMQALWLDKKISDQEIQKSYQGWRAHINKGNSFYIIQDMDNYFHSLFKGVKII